MKGGRFITHMKKLRDVEVPLANFFASGVLALREKFGPMLWQLPPNLGFDAERLAAFFARLPRSTGEAAWLARRHDERMKDRALTETDTDRPIRHALEVRHKSFETPAFLDLLREHHVAIVVADTAGKWPQIREVTADFGTYACTAPTSCTSAATATKRLEEWARYVDGIAQGGRDVYVYFDNDAKVHAPYNAICLTEKLAQLH